jgi:hypothetical protein
MEGICGMCKFFINEDSTVQGWCHRYPPKGYVRETPDGSQYHEAFFPYLDDPWATRCGEYVPASSEGGPE